MEWRQVPIIFGRPVSTIGWAAPGFCIVGDGGIVRTLWTDGWRRAGNVKGKVTGSMKVAGSTATAFIINHEEVFLARVVAVGFVLAVFLLRSNRSFQAV
jgi:hypothetical protein